MERFLRLGLGVALGAILLTIAVPTALATTKTFSFDDGSYGDDDPDCIDPPNPAPPMFNRPEYGNQTKDYIVDPAGCGLGGCGLSDGSASFLTSFYATTGANSNEVRFSWVDPANDDTWLRLLTYAAGSITPIYQSPTLYIWDGASVSMDILIFGTDGLEDTDCNTTAYGSELEFALVVRETGQNLPLGEDGGTSGTLEFVGLDSIGGTVDPNTPIGGTTVAADVWTNVKWTFVDTDADDIVDKVDVSINGGAATQKSIVAFTGDGLLSATFNRGTIDGLAIRKPAADDVSKKWFINVDNVVIDAPGITDPVQVAAPVWAYNTEVTVRNINTTATEVKLYRNTSELLGTAVNGVGGADFSDGEHVFTGLTLAEGQLLSATQTVDSVESAQSAQVPVLSAVIMKDDFDSYADQAAFNAAWPVVGDITEADRITLSEITAASCPKSALEPGTTGGSTALRAMVARTITGAQAAGGYAATDAEPLVLTVWILHDQGTQNRSWISIIGYGGHSYGSGSLDTWLRIGMYNSPPANTAIYQCGVNDGYSGTFPINMDQGPDGLTGTDVATRKPGTWVKWRIRIKTSTVEFLVDDVLYKVFARPNTTDTFDSVRIGSGYTNTSNAIWYDNLSVSIGDQEPYPAPLPLVTVNGPLSPASTQVTVTNVDSTATDVEVYKNTGTFVGSISTGGAATVNVPVTGLADGDIVQARQKIGADWSCLSYSRVKVFASLVGTLRMTLTVRDAMTTLTGPVGADPGDPSGALEYIGSSLPVGSVPQGHPVVPGPNWQTVTFNPPTAGGTDPVRAALGTGGNSVIDGAGAEHWCVIDSLAIAVDATAPRPGPYTLYVDSIENDGVVFGNFDSYPNGEDQVMFRHPGYSGSTSGNVKTSPTPTSKVSSASSESGPNSCKLFWEFVDAGAGRWARVTPYKNSKQGDPMVRLDKPVTVKFLLCPGQPVSIGNVLVDEATVVSVTGVDPAAQTVQVYVNGTLAKTAAGTGGTTVDVTLDNPLQDGDVVTATQTLDSTEGCFSTAVTVGDCAQVSAVTVQGPLAAGASSVSVTNVDPGADPVTVYAGGVEIGSAPAAGNTTVVVPVSPDLVQGAVITARQTISGLIACVPASGPVVGSGGNSGVLRIALGIREPDPASGDDLEWVGASGTAGGPVAPTQTISPSTSWQTLTWDNLSSVQEYTGNGVVDPGTVDPDIGVVRIDHLAIIRDAGNTDTGPWVLYVDTITNGASTIQDWDAATLGSTFFFQQPSYSGSTSGYLVYPPNSSIVTDEHANSGTQSEKINWQWIDGTSSRWLRVVTSGMANSAISVNLTDGVSIRFLLLPAVECNPVWADGDGDNDVDAVDFGYFQRCLTTPTTSIQSGCECFDFTGDLKIDINDLAAFSNCAQGSGVAATPGCGN